MKFEEVVQVALILLCTILLMYYIKWKYSRWHLYKLATKIPLNENLSRLPLIGAGVSFMGNTEQILKNIKTLFHTTSPPQSMWLGPKFCVLINRAEDIEVVLNSPKCLAKDDVYQMVESALGDGIFTSSETTMGVSINAQSTDCTIYRATKKAMDILMFRLGNVFFHFDWIFNWFDLSKELRDCAETYAKFVRTVIEKKIFEYERNAIDDAEIAQIEEVNKRPVLLEQLVELSANGENWSTEDLRAESATIIVAGSNTSATVASLTLIMLAMHPDIQQMCHEEIIQVLGPDRNPAHTDLPKFVYLEKVIKETMRLFPIAPIILRKVDEDLEVGGYTIPRGSSLIVGIMGIHHSDKYYKDPWKFDPERFSSDEILKRHKYAYIPFSAGPRNCVGVTYAMMMIKTLICVTLRKFQVETTYKDIKEIRLKQAVIIEAIPLRLLPRN